MAVGDGSVVVRWRFDGVDGDQPQSNGGLVVACDGLMVVTIVQGLRSRDNLVFFIFRSISFL